jgi:hypothetical protein
MHSTCCAEHWLCATTADLSTKPKLLLKRALNYVSAAIQARKIFAGGPECFVTDVLNTSRLQLSMCGTASSQFFLCTNDGWLFLVELFYVCTSKVRTCPEVLHDLELCSLGTFAPIASWLDRQQTHAQHDCLPLGVDTCRVAFLSAQFFVNLLARFQIR